MIKVELMKETDSKEWNDFTDSNDYGWAMHRTEWEKLMPFFGLKPMYLTAKENEKIVGIIPLVHFKNRFVNFLDSPGIGNAGLCVKQKNKEKIIKAILEKIDEIAKKTNAHFFVNRANINSPKLVGKKADYWLEEHGFQKSPEHTFLLDLEKPLEKIQKEMNRKCRKSIKISEKNNLKFEKGTEKDIETYYKLHEKMCKRTGLGVEDFDYQKQLFDLSKKKLANFFIIKHQNKIIGGSIQIAYKKVIHYWNTVYDPDFLHLKTNDFLIWNLIKFGKENKFKWLDLGGVRIKPIGFTDKKSLGMFRFKKTFGGELYEIPREIKVYKPLRKAFAFWLIRLYNDFPVKIAGKDKISLFGLL